MPKPDCKSIYNKINYFHFIDRRHKIYRTSHVTLISFFASSPFTSIPVEELTEILRK